MLSTENQKGVIAVQSLWHERLSGSQLTCVLSRDTYLCLLLFWGVLPRDTGFQVCMVSLNLANIIENRYPTRNHILLISGKNA